MKLHSIEEKNVSNPLWSISSTPAVLIIILYYIQPHSSCAYWYLNQGAGAAAIHEAYFASSQFCRSSSKLTKLILLDSLQKEVRVKLTVKRVARPSLGWVSVLVSHNLIFTGLKKACHQTILILPQWRCRNLRNFRLDFENEASEHSS